MHDPPRLTKSSSAAPGESFDLEGAPAFWEENRSKLVQMTFIGGIIQDSHRRYPPIVDGMGLNMIVLVIVVI